MKRILYLVLACFFCSPLLAEDWVSFFHRTKELLQRMPITKNNDDPATWQEYSEVAKRLAQEDSTSAQKEVAELADVYEKNPDIRGVLTSLLSNAGLLRVDTAEAFKPIVATLITHLYDDTETRRGAMQVFVMFQNPPLEILAPAVDFSRQEEDDGAFLLLAKFCHKSKGAMYALRDAAAPNQPAQKRINAIRTIGNAAMNRTDQVSCRDPELVNTLAEALRSDQPDIVDDAVVAAERFGKDATPLRNELERVAQQDTPAAPRARHLLSQLQTN